MEIANKISVLQINISYAMCFLNDDILQSIKIYINYHVIEFIAKNWKTFNLLSQIYRIQLDMSIV